MKDFSFGSFTDDFVRDLAAWIGERRVLEVFAGNGLLASKLSKLGVDIIATSLFQGHDGRQYGVYFEVLEMAAAEAVAKYGRTSDVLLMSWPTSTEGAAHATALWDASKPIAFIGEVTDLSKNQLGGCASDLFFEMTTEERVFNTYSPRNYIERAAVRYAKPNALEIWDQAAEQRTGLANEFLKELGMKSGY